MDNNKVSVGLKLISSSLVKNYKFIIILLLAAIFIYTAYYVFKNYIKPKIDPSYVSNNEYVDKHSDDKGIAEVYMFKVDWCPHCKKALPIWESFSEDYQDKIINGYTLDFKLIDGEADSETTDKYNVLGYPTIKLIKDNQIIEYDAKPDYDTLLQFLNSAL